MMIKFSQIFNINKKEWPRVFVAWSLMFLLRFGFILGWSVMIATFLNKVGINLLPLLFLINALMIMCGTLIFRKLIQKIRRELFISIMAICASATLIASIFFIQSDSLLFFGLLILAESVFLAQLHIMISLFNEELFTPLESQRTFPIIESAETIGAITAGLMLGFFAEFIPAYKFIILWSISLLLILPIVLFFNAKTLDAPKLVLIQEEEDEHKKKKNIKDSFSNIKKVPFLKGVMVVVLLHWAIMNMVEFQYTKAIQQEVYSEQEETLLSKEDSEFVILSNEGFTEAQNTHYESQLTKKLGSLHALFNAGALFLQLLIAGRIIQKLGIIPSIALHPLVTLINVIILFLKFNFTSAVIARGGYEISGILFKNSYDSSYYAIPHHQRAEVKEFMQGIVKPLGAILGTIVIILIAINVKGANQTLLMNGVLILASILMLIKSINLKETYTKISEHNLSKKMDLPSRLNAIEILAQNGHKHFTPSLLKLLKRENEPEIIKENVLKTLGLRKNPESINAILETMESSSNNLRLTAVKTLLKFKNSKEIMKNSFTKARLISSLEEVLEKESEFVILENLVLCFYEFEPDKLTEFLLGKIKAKDKKADSYIRMLKLFKDPNLKYYLEPFLQDKNPTIRASAVVALWQFEDLRIELKHYLKQMMDSPKESIQILAIKTCGDVKFRASIPFLRNAINSENQDLSESAIISLGQMNEEFAIDLIKDKIVDVRHEWHENSNLILRRFTENYAEKVEHAVRHDASKQIFEIVSKYKNINQIEAKTLKTLRKLYHKLQAHHEAHQIKLALDKNE